MYQASVVAAGSSCQSQLKTCSNGTFNGSVAYQYQTCRRQMYWTQMREDVGGGYATCTVYEGLSCSTPGSSTRCSHVNRPSQYQTWLCYQP